MNKDVPIPDRLKSFPIYKGFLVHFTVYVDGNGVPDFRVVNEKNRRLCMENNWCAICGQPLVKPYVFIAGPISILESHVFVDGPMHDSCALYSVKVCPYLYNPHYTERPLDSSREKVGKDGGKSTTFAESVPGRPAKMALYYTNGYNLILDRPTIYYKADYPIKVDWNTIPSR